MSHIIEHVARTYVALFVAPWPAEQIGVIAAVGVISLTTLALALAARHVTTTVATLLSARERYAGTEPADVAVLLGQSDPDADGHARPRAPGRALAVA